MNTTLNKEKLGFSVFIIALVLLWYMGKFVHIDTTLIQYYLGSVPKALSGSIFIFLYVIVTFFIWLSKDIFRITAAILFGAYESTLLVWIAEIFNACILFYLARSLGRKFVGQRMKVKLARLDQTISEANFLWLFLLRAVPLIPFRFLDLACGLTGISFTRYLAAVILGSPLRIFWLQFILAGVGEGLMNRPGLLVEYLLKNNAVLIFTFLYLILIMAVMFRLKPKR